MASCTDGASTISTTITGKFYGWIPMQFSDASVAALDRVSQFFIRNSNFLIQSLLSDPRRVRPHPVEDRRPRLSRIGERDRTAPRQMVSAIASPRAAPLGARPRTAESTRWSRGRSEERRVGKE